MKICMFTNTYLPHVSGVANSVAAFAEDVSQMGHRVLVVAPTFPGMDAEREENEEILRVPAIQNFNGSDFSVRIPVPFIIGNRIDEFKPDLIHSHHPFMMGDAAMRTALRLNLPLIFTHHTRYEEYTHYVPADSAAMKRFVVSLTTEYANMCSHVIAPSQSIADLIRKRDVKTPVAIIPTGIDTAAFAAGQGERFRMRMKIPKRQPIIGHVGRLAPEKNLAYLTYAVADVIKNKLPSGYFLAVGSGPSETQIKDIFEENRIADHLILPGRLTGQALHDAYKAMDLFVFSSTSETQGMVLAEAMAAGIPVIALDASGAREVVKDRENGRLLSRDAPVGVFSEAIAEFFSRPEIQRKWRDNTHKTAKQFSRRRCSGNLVKLYKSVTTEACMTKNRCQIPPQDLWEKLLRRIAIEWEMLSEKAAAMKTRLTP